MKQENTDRMTKWRTDSIYSPKDLNMHDPHEMYRWQDEKPVPLLGCGRCGYWVHLDSLWVFICSLYSRSYFKG
jgi:hypothetical protein